MRIGILTFHRAINAGAVLQAYAMQETLKRLQHDVSIIDYRPSYIDIAYLPIRKLDIRHPRGLIYELFSSPLRYLRIKGYRDFANTYLNLEKITDSQYYDYVILGSDQIWNPSITGGKFDPIFFNASAHRFGNKSIAYAASTMSTEKLNNPDIRDLIHYLPKIDAIGVREKSLQEFILNTFHIETEHVIDPTLIASKEIFDKMISNRLVKDNYLLFYEVWHNDEVEKKARDIARNKGLKFIGISGSDIRKPRKDIIQIYSPKDFVNLIAHSNHVVTSSFHGTAFSLIFEKQFNVICEEPHQAVRMQELLKTINYSHKFSYKLDPVNDEEIDYTEVNDLLNIEKKKSIKFLIKNLQ